MFAQLSIIGLLAFIFGYAVNRANTCATAAIKDLVYNRRPHRMIALGVSAAWAAAVLIPGTWLFPAHFFRPAPVPFVHAILGGAMFGYGAYINRACSFGTLYHLTSGDLNFLGALFGMFAGIFAALRLGFDAPAALPTNPEKTAVLQVLLYAIAILAILLSFFNEHDEGNRRLRSFGSNTVHAVAVGMTGAILYAAFGRWTYATLISDGAHLAAGSLRIAAIETMLTAILSAIGGGIAASIGSGGFLLRSFRPRAFSQHFAGGIFLGIGSLLIGGGNDFLLVYGAPSGSSFAFIALAAMTATLLVIFCLEKHLRADRH